MPTTTVSPQLAQTIAQTLKLLRAERADASPDHDPLRCEGLCRCCTTERILNRLLDKLPRGK